MPVAFLILIACQLAGETMRTGLGLPVPGPVIAMLLLATVLVIADRRRQAAIGPARLSLEKTSEGLIAHMGLLFVPAGVGIVAQLRLIEEQWFPIVTALIGSTLLSVLATGLTLHWFMRDERGQVADPVQR